MSPDSEEPTINLPNNDDGDQGRKDPETPPGEGEEFEATVVSEVGEDMTVVTDAEEDATMGPDGETAPPPVRATAPPSTTEATAGGASHVFANRFEVVALLGEGGMGRVYKVRDRQIEGREVALKVLRPRYSRNARFRDLFFQEIRAAQKFVSEQVNQVRDTGQMEDGRLFLTMDLVSGEDLRALMKREKSLNTRHALEIIRQMLLALQSGHEQGFVHRDVKPPNVMLATQVSKTDENPYGVGVRLLDFGIAALAAEVGEGTVAGTPMYMSPEQATGQRLDARSDLFSVGIVLYEMLSGARPFEGATLQEISTSLVETQVAPMIKGLDHLKPAVQKILRKALEKDRDKRYQSAGEFIDAIESSKAYRVETGAPGWVSGLLVLSLLAAAGEGGIIYMNGQELDRLNEDLRVAGDTKNDALLAAETKYRGEVGETKIAHDAIVAGLNEELRNLRTQVTNQGFEEQTDNLAESEFEQMKRDLEAAIADAAEAKAERALLASSNAKLLEDYRALEQQVDSNDMQQRAEPQAIKGFDQFLGYIDNGHWTVGAEFLSRRISENIYVRDGLSGGDELQVLADAAKFLGEYLDELEAGGEPRRKLLSQAESRASLAESQTGQFETSAKVWLTFKLEGEVSDPARLASWVQAIEKIKAKIALTFEEHNSRSAADAKLLTDGKADQDPSPVIASGEEIGWDDFDVFFGKLVAWIETAERDGSLDLEALKGISTLDEWGAYIVSSQSQVPDQYADVIRWFYYAKKWYVDNDASLIGPGLDEVAQSGSTPKSDWRAVLALQIELGGLPDVMGKYAQWYRQENRGGKILWVQDRVKDRPEDVSGTGKVRWSVDRFTYDPKSKPSQNVEFEFQKGVLYGPGNVQLVELFNPDAKVAWWEAPADVTTQNFLQFPSEDELAQFSSSYPAPGLPCLVFVDKNRVERWFSPELGIVFEHSEDRYTRELFCR